MTATEARPLAGRRPARTTPPEPLSGRGRHRAPAPPVPRLLRSLWLSAAVPLLLGFGVEVRLFQWLGSRSLWLDEALIARSLVSRGYVELVSSPLQGDQAAPVLWLWASRLSIDLFGDGERALRLVPLLGGFASLVLFWRLARHLLPPVLVPVAVALVVLSPPLVYFSNEAKPYSVDVAVVLGLLLLAVRLPREPRARDLRPLALTGAVAVWASFAAILVLAGLSLVLVLRALRAGGLRRAIEATVVLSAWVLSLAVSYVAVLHRLRSSNVLSDFWAYTFPDSTLDLPTWLLRRTVDLIHDPLQLAVWPLALALLVLGTVRVARLSGRRWLLATAGVPVAVAAAAASAYPLASRLALWLVPLAAIALAAVLPATLERARALMAGAAALTLVAAPAAADVLAQTHELHQVEELRPVMEQVAAAKRPSDVVLVDIPAKAPFDFYSPTTGLQRSGVILFATEKEVGGRCNDPAALATGEFARRRVWVVFAHQLADTARLGTRADMITRIESVTGLRRTIQEYGAQALLFDPVAPRVRTSEPRNPLRCLRVVRTDGPVL